MARLDKFLWAARFYKTRALAVEAIAAGRVAVNGERAKPAKAVRIGDRLGIRRAPFEQLGVVRELAEQRGPARVAQALYDETEQSRARREAVARELRAAPPPAFNGRPTKKTRRDYEKWLYSRDEE